MDKPHIILASASIGRKTLLQKLGVPFQVVVSDIDESHITHTNPFKMLQKRARAKAEDAVRQLSTSPSPLLTKERKRLIVAADSMAVLGNKTYGKIPSPELKQVLLDLMGKTHIFATATCIIQLRYLKSPRLLKETDRWEDLTKTRVTLRKISSLELDEYISRYDFTRFAAGYTLNETPWDLVTKIDGSYTNVIGLPFEVILPIFRKYDLLYI